MEVGGFKQRTGEGRCLSGRWPSPGPQSIHAPRACTAPSGPNSCRLARAARYAARKPLVVAQLAEHIFHVQQSSRLAGFQVAPPRSAGRRGDRPGLETHPDSPPRYKRSTRPPPAPSAQFRRRWQAARAPPGNRNLGNALRAVHDQSCQGVLNGGAGKAGDQLVAVGAEGRCPAPGAGWAWLPAPYNPARSPRTAAAGRPRGRNGCPPAVPDKLMA